MMAYEGPAMKILTWNVLHRVHAERHSEPAIERWPDEQGRVRGITALIARALTVEGFDVALLQEVSGDVLAPFARSSPDTRCSTISTRGCPERRATRCAIRRSTSW